MTRPKKSTRPPSSTTTPEVDERRTVGELAAVLERHDGDPAALAAVLRTLADAIETIGAVPRCRIRPFVRGRRPTTEARSPGLGSSDTAALITGGDPEHNRAIVLFDAGPSHPRRTLHATIRWELPDGRLGEPLPGWDRRPLPSGTDGDGSVRELSIHPERDLPADDLGFEHGFLRRAVVQLSAAWDDVTVASDEIRLDVCDIRHLGTLYARILDRVVAPDADRQARAWPADAARGITPIHHPWAPVLIIGTEKAALYTQALVSDIVEKTDHLSDPSWLVRVGVYLELLTCLGIVEAVRDDVGDLLTPEERHHFEHAPALAEIRARIDPDAWRTVWEHRSIAPPRKGMPRAGSVSAVNLINKKRATLAFLHVHHEDLKHAIDLAGPNLHNSQETWQRVFRDAERAVLGKTALVFPELAFLPGPMREIALWQQQGIAGQQGLYPTACTQYRASMNHVADWARSRGLMDHTGAECIPLRVSLLHATMNQPDRVAILERADGYLDAAADERPGDAGDERDAAAMADEFERLLGSLDIFSLHSADERRLLAATAVPLFLVPGERIIVQGNPGESLFVVADGEVEVVLRRDGVDVTVDVLGPGQMVGEMALLTGEPRAASVRAVDNAMLLEIGRRQYEPLLRAHPEWVDQLAAMMDDRLRRREERLQQGSLRRKADRSGGTTTRDRILRHFFAT